MKKLLQNEKFLIGLIFIIALSLRLTIALSPTRFYADDIDFNNIANGILEGKGYSDMGISGGGEASVAFYDIYSNDGVKADASRIRRELEEYCGLDTYGMVLIVGKLQSLVK